MKHAHPSVSDVRREAGETRSGSIRQDDSAAASAETPLSPPPAETSRGEPFGWLHTAPHAEEKFSRNPLNEADKAAGWTETALYTHPLPTVTEDYAGLIERLEDKREKAIGFEPWGPYIYSTDMPDEDCQEAAQALRTLQQKNKELEADRDEWRTQHENLLSVRATDIATLLANVETADRFAKINIGVAGKLAERLTASQAEAESYRKVLEEKISFWRDQEREWSKSAKDPTSFMVAAAARHKAEALEELRAALSKKPAAEEGEQA